MTTPENLTLVHGGGIVVVGSLNMDLVVRCGSIPSPGETVAGGDLREEPGGKGANQAVAAARLSAGRGVVRMVGQVGDDAFGGRLVRGLRDAGVDVARVRTLAGAASGTALILVDDHGENAIVVSPGANGRFTPSDLPGEVLTGAGIVLLQLEVSAATVAATIAAARRAAGRPYVILDPTPVPGDGRLPAELYAVDLLTPNQTEAEALTGVPVSTADDAHRAASVLLVRGPTRVVIKLGSSGSTVSERDTAGQVVTRHVPGFAVRAVDSTAAGDTFNGALAVALAEGRPLVEAVRFANAAGALACTRPGAQASIPTREEVDHLLN